MSRRVKSDSFTGSEQNLSGLDRYREILRVGTVFTDSIHGCGYLREEMLKRYRLDSIRLSPNLKERMPASVFFNLKYHGNIYGHEEIIRDYAGLKGEEEFCAVVEHAPYMGEVVYSNEVNCIYPLLIVSSLNRALIDDRLHRNRFAHRLLCDPRYSPLGVSTEDFVQEPTGPASKSNDRRSEVGGKGNGGDFVSLH